MEGKAVVQRVIDQLHGQQLVPLDDYVLHVGLTADHGWGDLPIKNFDGDLSTTHVTHAFDIVEGDGPVPSVDSLHEALIMGGNLPREWSLKGHLQPCTTEYLLIVDGTSWKAIKHLHFHIRAPVMRLMQTFVGNLKVLDVKKINSPRHTPHVIHYLMTHMGGSGLFRKELQIIEKPNKGYMTAEQINRGYDFIQEHGPKGTSQNQNMRWADVQRHDATSPIYGWTAGLIKEALHNLTAGKSLAQLIDKYPVSLHDVKNFVLLRVLQPVLARASDTGLLLVGVSGLGKTPLANAVGMAVSGWWLQHHGQAGTPSIKTTNHVDFLRSEPGSIYTPVIYDDGELEVDKASVLKAFFDVGSEDTKVYARWGASAFEKHQYRIGCSNTFEPDAEPATTPGDIIDHDQFLKLISSTFNSSIKKEDLMAVLKRVNVVVFGHLRVYVRKASEKPIYINTVEYDTVGGRDLLVPDCKSRIRAHKRGQDPELPSEHQAWSVRFINAVMAGEELKGFHSCGPSVCPFTGKSSPGEDYKPALLMNGINPTNGTDAPPVPKQNNGDIDLDGPQFNGTSTGSSSTRPGDAIQPAVPAAPAPMPCQSSDMMVVSTDPMVRRRSFGKRLTQSQSSQIIDISSPDNKRPRVEVHPQSSQPAQSPHEGQLEAELEALMNDLSPADASD